MSRPGRRSALARRRGALLLAIALVGAGSWLVFGRDGNGDGGAANERPFESPPLPGSPGAVTLEGSDTIRVDFKKPPRAGLVFDLHTGEVLWRRNPLRVRSIASLTKVMTALVVVSRTTGRERVRITKAALRYRERGLGLLKGRKSVTLNALMHGLLITSANDAAIALAVHVAGSEERFVRLMNRRARLLGLRCTHFVSSHGLEDGNRSCAADLAALTRIAMNEPRIAAVANKPQAAVRFPIRGGKLYVTTTNPLLRTGYPGVIGLKTGTTDAAGHCYIAVVRTRTRTLGVILLRSRNIESQARKLLRAAARSA